MSTPRALLLLLLTLSLVGATGCDGLSSVELGAPKTRSSRLREARSGARVEWRQGEQTLGKWRVERRRIRVYDAKHALVGAVSAERDANNRLRAVLIEPLGAPSAERKPEGAAWTLAPDVRVSVEPARVVVSDGQGSQRGAITVDGEALVWTGFEQGDPLKALRRADQIVVEQGGAVALTVRDLYVEPSDALVQLIPAIGPLERAALSMIIADWSAARAPR